MDDRLESFAEGLRSSNSLERLVSLEALIGRMRSVDLEEQVSAIKLTASVLKYPDYDMVQKAASALIELGSVGYRYVYFSIANPEISKSRKDLLFQHFKMCPTDKRHREYNLNWNELPLLAREVILEALKESEYHGFSSVFSGLVKKNDVTIMSYVFEIDLSRHGNKQGCISFGAFESKMEIKPLLSG